MTKPRELKAPERALALRDSLVNETSSVRKRRSIERVWNALEAMRRRGAVDWRLAAVAKELGEEGPREQSLRNKEGEPYRQLIDAYAEEVAPAKKPAISDGDEDLVLSINDPALSARVAVVLANNKALRRRNDLLHAQVRELSAAAMAVPHKADNASPTQAFNAPHPEMARSISGFLSSVSGFGWSIDPSGAILDRHGSEIAGPLFVDALRAMVAAAGAPRALGPGPTQEASNAPQKGKRASKP